jgi:hypothetical protein
MVNYLSDVRSGAIADSWRAATAALFDHLVGAGRQHWRRIKAECLCGFQSATNNR